jgi:hypothetical protein
VLSEPIVLCEAGLVGRIGRLSFLVDKIKLHETTVLLDHCEPAERGE